MTFEDNQFSVVLDKGTFDALMSNKSQTVGSIKIELIIFFYGKKQNLGSSRYRSNSSTN